MKTVGTRQVQPVVFYASGALLAKGARFSEAMSHFSRTTFIPKGVYRFNTHEAANQHWQNCLVQGMADLAMART